MGDRGRRVLVLCATLGGCGPARPAAGQGRAPEDQLKERFATYRTFAVDVGNSEGTSYLLRGDGLGRLVMDGGEFDDRVLWDGVHLTMDFNGLDQPEAPTQTFGPAVDQRMADIVAEVRAGFPNTEFLDEAPSSVGYLRFGATESSFLWRRVDFPGPSDDPWRIFFAMNRVSHDLTAVLLLTPDGEPAPVPRQLGRFGQGFGQWKWDVPIEDDLDRAEAWPYDQVWQDPTKWANLYISPERMLEAEPPDYRMLPYHERYDRFAPTFRPDPSTGRTPPPPAPQVESAWASWEGSCTPNAVHAVPFRWVWRPDPTSLDWQGVDAAVAGGCPIRVELHPRATLQLGPGTDARIQGTVVVRQLGPVTGTNWADTFDVRRTGALQEESALSWTAAIGAAAPAQVEILVDGTATLTCPPDPSPAVQRVAFEAARDGTLPLFRWSGCMPVPPPRQ